MEAAARESQRVRAYAQALEAARRELEAAYRRLEEMDRLKDEFLATVSHELKTPLTAVRALAEILAQEEVGEEERRRFTALLAQEAARLSRLVEEILAYTRLEARPEEPPAPVDLEALAREALALSEPLARERGLRLEPGSSPSGSGPTGTGPSRSSSTSSPTPCATPEAGWSWSFARKRGRPASAWWTTAPGSPRP